MQLTPKFNIDLVRGAVFEDWFCEYRRKRGGRPVKTSGFFPAFDVEDQGRTYELKHDIYSNRTGNYALEKRSLEKSKADFLVIGTPSEAYFLPLETARTIYRAYPERRIGDSPDNWGVLVPKQELINYAQRL
jgi:hypothetical protein